MIVYAQGTYGERIPQTIEAYKRLGPHVDRRIVIVDETVTKEQLDQLHALDIETYVEKWTDDFPAMRNAYLAKCQEGDWVIVSDPDEWFSESFYTDVRKLVAEFDAKHVVKVMINSHDMIDGVETKSDFYKDLIFKYRWGAMYKNPIHEELVVPCGPDEQGLKLKDEYFYMHYRTRAEILERAARNVYIGGGGRNLDTAMGKAWKELVDTCKKLGITTWADFKTYLQFGQVDGTLKQWILDHRFEGSGWQCEAVDLFRWYFQILHPDENTGNWGVIKGVSIMNMNDPESIITLLYQKHLKRAPDQTGLSAYINAMKQGATMYDVELAIASSDEAKQKGGAVNAVLSRQGDVVYCQCTYGERVWQTKEAVKKMAANVDRVVLIIDQTVTPEQKQELRDINPNVELFMFKWVDNFPEFRNHYLDQLQPGDWCIVSDPDEWFNDNFAKAVKSICQEGEHGNVRLMLINAKDVIHETGKPDNTISGSYYKNLLFRYMPGTKYIGVGITKNVHEILHQTAPGRDVRLADTFWYEHHKTAADMWERSMRNVYIGGGGNNVGSLNKSWRALHDICGDLHVFSWNQLRDIMRKGKIDPRFIYWLNHNRRAGYDYQNEMVEAWKWYFVHLHPEENVDHLEPLPADVDDAKIAMMKLVEDKFLAILGRNATTDEKEKITTAVMEGQIARENIDAILKGTDEYKRLHSPAPVPSDDYSIWDRAVRVTCKAETNGAGNDRSDASALAPRVALFKETCPPDKFKVVLDEGAGAGVETALLIKEGYKVVGTTFGKDNIDIAKKEYGVQLVEMDMHDIKVKPGFFDAIFTVQCFEHSFAPWLAILESRRVLRDGGRIFIDVPSPDNQELLDTIWHTATLYPNQWTSLFKKAGFKLVSSKGSTKDNYVLVYEKLPNDTFPSWQYLQHVFK